MNIVAIILITATLLTAGVAVLLLRRLNRMRRELAEAQARTSEISGFLARFSSGLQSDEGLRGTILAAARYVSEQTRAESVAIYEARGETLHGIGCYGPYPLLGSRSTPAAGESAGVCDEHIPFNEGFIGEIAHCQVPELVEQVELDARFKCWAGRPIRTVMAAPMMRNGLLLGVLVAVNNRDRGGQPFSHAQFQRLKLLATQVLLVIDLARVYGGISQQERIAQELDFARSLQQSMLPKSYPDWGNFSIYAKTRPAKEVNGDFYDIIRIDDDRMLVLLGDAAGKGVPACLLSAMARSFARGMIDNFTTLTDFMCGLNQKLCRDSDADRFITMGCCLIDKRRSLVELGRAGHTDMVCYIHRHLRILSPAGSMLGMLPPELANFETICLALDPGSKVMLFSDGLNEATDAAGTEFGFERLARSFARIAAAGIPDNAIPEAIIQSVQNYEAVQGDDQTVVLISVADNAAGTADNG